MSKTQKEMIRIRARKLGREKALGLAHSHNLIEYDPRQDSKELLDTLIHETLHKLDPDLSEKAVRNQAGTITNALWVMGYRRVYDA